VTQIQLTLDVVDDDRAAMTFIRLMQPIMRMARDAERSGIGWQMSIDGSAVSTTDVREAMSNARSAAMRRAGSA
jgi:hypothetical protein